MLRIFISYSTDANDYYANELKKFLEDIEELSIEVILAPKKSDKMVANVDKIADLIDSSQVFICLYTSEPDNEGKSGTNGKDNHWVNQELGYAINHARNDWLEIIPVFHEHDDLEAFLISKYTNASSEFSLKDNDFEAIKMNIRDYLIEKYYHPIEINLELYDKVEREKDGKIFRRFILTITNKTAKMVNSSILDIVLPSGMGLYHPTERGWYDPVFKMVDPHTKIYLSQYTNIIPKSHYKKFKIAQKKIGKSDKIDINRYAYLLQDLYPLSANQATLVFKFNEEIKHFDFGLYLTSPKFGTTYYKGDMYRDEKRGKGDLRNFARTDNPISIIDIKAEHEK